MKEANQKKRLFFGLSVEAPWPETYPKGRLIDEPFRHITFAFLGDVKSQDTLRLCQLLEHDFPLTSITLGGVGKFDQLLFLPPRHPHVVAWHAALSSDSSPLIAQHDLFVDWLEKNGFSIDRRHPFTPHVTIARDPRNEKEWIASFRPLAFVITALHLYESLGNSQYRPLFSHFFKRPFEEIEHTGDVAFCIRGRNIDELYLHAKIALSFLFPPFIRFFEEPLQEQSLESIIRNLNQKVALLDTELGCPFKAISYHTKTKESEKFIEWEMIVDV